jgi:hypothetical protein
MAQPYTKRHQDWRNERRTNGKKKKKGGEGGRLGEEMISCKLYSERHTLLGKDVPR